jgi:hypothetical protein
VRQTAPDLLSSETPFLTQELLQRKNLALIDDGEGRNVRDGRSGRDRVGFECAVERIRWSEEVQDEERGWEDGAGGDVGDVLLDSSSADFIL